MHTNTSRSRRCVAKVTKSWDLQPIQKFHDEQLLDFLLRQQLAKLKRDKCEALRERRRLQRAFKKGMIAEWSRSREGHAREERRRRKAVVPSNSRLNLGLEAQASRSDQLAVDDTCLDTCMPAAPSSQHGLVENESEQVPSKTLDNALQMSEIPLRDDGKYIDTTVPRHMSNVPASRPKDIAAEPGNPDFESVKMEEVKPWTDTNVEAKPSLCTIL